MQTLLLAALFSAVFAATKNLIPSPFDKCSYRHITLDNKLEVLLVQDPTCQLAQVSLDVNVGSMHEPDEYNGLAHLLEHTHKLGSSKYPVEGNFKGFIGMHSGTANAYTGPENTNFYFTVGQDHIEEALDRFAQFFISPTFGLSGKNDEMESGILREINAVDSEFRIRIQNEAFRLDRMVSLLCGEKHPYSRFEVGNLETLKRDGIVEAVISFFNKHYSANLMKLVLRSGLDLNAVEKLIKKVFSAIPNLDLPPTVWELPAFTETGKLVKYKLLQEGREVHYVFTVPGPEPYKTAPYKFLSNLMRNESEQGLIFQLRQHGLASVVNPRIIFNSRGFSIFCITFTLSPRGMEQVDTITHNLFAYMTFVKASINSNEMSELFGDLKKLHNFAVLFEVKGRDYAVNKAGWMHRTDREKDSMMTSLDFDPEQLDKCWSYLTMSNVNVVLSSNQFEYLPLKEKFYEIEYSVEKLKLNNGGKLLQFRLPRPNKFIPENIQFYGNLAIPTSNSTQRPELIAEDLWFKMDDSFGQPKSIIFISLQSNSAYNDPTMVMRSNGLSEYISKDLHLSASLPIYMSIFTSQMANILQELEMANIDVGFFSKTIGGGLDITISGFSDKLPKALEVIIEELTRPLKQGYFENVKTLKIKKLRNRLLEPSFLQAESTMYENIVVGYFPIEKIIETTKALEWEDIKLELLTGLKPTMLVVGNTLRETTVRLFDNLKMAFRGKEDRKMQAFDWSYVGKVFERGPIAHLDNAIAIYYPITKETNYRVYGAVLMLNSILSQAFFDALRTREQLGYIVKMKSHTILDSVGFMFEVQSKIDPRKLNERVHKFISEEAKAILDKLSTRELNAVKDSLFTTSLSRPNSLLQEAEDYWRVITSSSDLCFEKFISIRLYLNITPIETLKMEMINIINMMSSPKKSIAVHVWGKGTEPRNG